MCSRELKEVEHADLSRERFVAPDILDCDTTALADVFEHVGDRIIGKCHVFDFAKCLLRKLGLLFQLRVSGKHRRFLLFEYPVCAERNAVAAMVAAGEREIMAVAVVTDLKTPASPCGACRQVIAEFGPGAKIVMANLKGAVQVRSLSALLPLQFKKQKK